RERTAVGALRPPLGVAVAAPLADHTDPGRGTRGDVRGVYGPGPTAAAAGAPGGDAAGAAGADHPARRPDPRQAVGPHRTVAVRAAGGRLRDRRRHRSDGPLRPHGGAPAPAGVGSARRLARDSTGPASLMLPHCLRLRRAPPSPPAVRLLRARPGG